MVTPAPQHQGIAKAMIEEAVARAKQTACKGST
ncbi:GNAT family N-acetyltransferase [Sinorhizobium meliloti]|nr:GNAT family N-acetyltransferase [Sinorhizobium meliloti]